MEGISADNLQGLRFSKCRAGHAIKNIVIAETWVEGESTKTTRFEVLQETCNNYKIFFQ